MQECRYVRYVHYIRYVRVEELVWPAGVLNESRCLRHGNGLDHAPTADSALTSYVAECSAYRRDTRRSTR